MTFFLLSVFKELKKAREENKLSRSKMWLWRNSWFTVLVTNELNH